MSFYHGDLETTWSNPEEKWRGDRLQRVIGYAAALDEITGTDVLGSVVHLHDHEGTLTVSWGAWAPNHIERALFVKAWNSYIGDNNDCVEHEIVVGGRKPAPDLSPTPFHIDLETA